MNIHAAVRRLLFFAMPLAFLTAGMTGCDRSGDSVTGKVTFRGGQLSNGAVILYCENQQIIHGLIGSDGTYAIPNVPHGRARVTVRVPAPQKELWRNRPQLPKANNGPIFPNSTQSDKVRSTPPIPARYELPEESGLAVTVNSGVTVFDINLAK
ncbi:carboxypeptidase-like regulatory domain-containing protein [Zavarzinella formosa]|uniref:carboxypeptidase-like regulatory domain-containing protein n=1 Tax=Zavarzinella formosa TaxID=360055 RepID=UPI000316F5D0|nr:carboxypeptidase-like regulatory domain-containing protein [Zavarzinella formosa]